jgi:Fic family protein
MPLRLRLIRAVHARLMEGVRGQEQRPGEFRHSPNLIGYRGATPETARFVPPPVREMTEALHDLERYVGERRDDVPFLVQLALVHYQFETIHPFMDGNGRIGRLLIALQLRERQYLPQPLLYLSAYFERHRDLYRDHLLSVSRSGAWSAWVDFFLQGIADQAADTAQRSYQLLDLLEQYQTWALSVSRSANLAKLAEFLFIRPVISVAHVEEWLGITYPAASRHVQQMIDGGILLEVTGRRRNRRFVAQDIVAIINPPDE